MYKSFTFLFSFYMLFSTPTHSLPSAIENDSSINLMGKAAREAGALLRHYFLRGKP